MKILITGATGFMGSKLTRRLLDMGYDLRVLIRDPKKLGGVLIRK